MESINKPTVSVIIPTFNGAKWITDAVQSVLNQTFNDFEIVVIDDGSTDNTKDILMPYLKNINLVTHELNLGLPAARNSGIKVAKGEFIAYLDGDDMWKSEKLALQVALLEKHKNVQIVFSNYEPFGDPVDYKTGFDRSRILRQLPKKGVGEDAYIITKAPLFIDILRDLFPWVSTILLRRECLEKVGLFDEKSRYSGEDWQMCLRLAKYFSFGYIDKCLVKRRERVGSQSKNGKDEVEAIKILEDIQNWVSLSKVERHAVLEKTAGLYFAVGYMKYSNYHLTEARFYFLASMKIYISLFNNINIPRRIFIDILYYIMTFLPEGYLRVLRLIKNYSNN